MGYFNIKTEVEHGVIEEIIRKMTDNHSFTAGLAVAIPTWIYSDRPTIDHAVMIGILLFTFFLDWITGTILAKRSPTRKLTSHQGIYTLMRDFLIITMCASSIGLDFVFESRSFIFAFFTAAFIWQNFYSFLGNVAALGWAKYFPIWLFKLVHDEMLAKIEKYFPNEKDKK